MLIFRTTFQSVYCSTSFIDEICFLGPISWDIKSLVQGNLTKIWICFPGSKAQICQFKHVENIDHNISCKPLQRSYNTIS